MEQNSQKLNSALLIMDIQSLTRKMLGDKAADLLDTLNKAIAAARAAGIPVIYVVVGFRKGFPEIDAFNRNKSFARLREAPHMPELQEPMSVDPGVAPAPGEMVVIKRRVSAFAGSDLAVILRAHRIEHLVLTGIATSGVVLSTLREAADLDYKMSVLSDCCADTDPEVHRVLLEKVFVRQADVVTTDEWVAQLS